MTDERQFTRDQREAMCRATLEPHGLTVKRFWIDSNDLGHAECEDHRGRLFLFSQKRKDT